MKYEDWAGSLEEDSDFTYIRCSKKIFPMNASKDIVHKFCDLMPQIIRQITECRRSGKAPYEHFIMKGGSSGVMVGEKFL